MSFFPRPLELRLALVCGCLAFCTYAPAQETVPPAATQTAPTAPPSRPHGAVRISSGVMAGLLVKKVDPVSPAGVGKMDAFVVLHVIVGTDGAPQELAVVSGPEELRAAALTAVQQWRWKVYLLNQQPTPVDTAVIIHFGPAE